MIKNAFKYTANHSVAWVRGDPLYPIMVFVAAWLIFGNFWSVLASLGNIDISFHVVSGSFFIYLVVTVPVVIAFFVALARLQSRIKWVVILEMVIFFAFVIAPPRSADSMRVWLAKVYDIFMMHHKFFRPYFHYSTPDAFTLFHLPLIDLWDGQVFQLSIWVALCATLILLMKIIRVYTEGEAAIMSVCLFLFNPLIILASTTVTTDIPMMLAVSGVVYTMILYERENSWKMLACMALFIAFGLNIKYNMMMFFPVLVLWLAKIKYKNNIPWMAFPIILFSAGLAILPYLMNYMNTGNPVWPALVHYFPSKVPYWDKVANMAEFGLTNGVRNVQGLVHSFCSLFLMPARINPIAMACIFFVYSKFKYLGRVPGLLVTSYLLLLWLMMPDFATGEKERYVLYIFPIIIPLGIAKLYSIFASSEKGEKARKAFKMIVGCTVLAYLVFTSFYSYSAVRYVLTQDEKVWHRSTWYYEDYDWINKNIMLDGPEKFLVMVAAQQTYYLRRPYINADGLSGLIDWSSLIDVNAVSNVLANNNIRYIFTDNSYLVEDPEAGRAVALLVQNGIIEKVRENKIKIYYGRLKDIYEEHVTVLYKVKRYENRTGGV